jgi:4-amino-4-deoxychorismate lyase
MILVNGERNDCVAITDRGFQYGDGLFETIEVIKGNPLFLEQHLLRLNTGCLRLNILSPDLKQLADEIYQVCNDATRSVLKIIITRGAGGRGYRTPEAIQPTRVVSLHAFPDYPESYPTLGIRARFCNTRLGLNPALAGIKHLNRLEQILARAEWNDPTIQEGLMLDINNHVIEGTMSNLFYVKRKAIFTAALQFSGVAGIMRGIIINLIAEHNLAVIEHDYNKDDLLAAEEVFVCNAIIGIWPVSQIGNSRFAIGDTTRQLQAWIKQLKEKEIFDAR